MWNPSQTEASAKLHAAFDEKCPGAIDSSMKEDEDDCVFISDLIGDSMNEPHWQRDENERRISVQLKSSSQSLSLLRELGSIHIDENEEVLMPPPDSSIQKLKRDLVRMMSSYKVTEEDDDVADRMAGVLDLHIPSLIAAAVIIALLYFVVTRPIMTFVVISFIFFTAKQYIVRKYNAEAAKMQMKDKRV